MTISELMKMIIDEEYQDIELWDIVTEETIYTGKYGDYDGEDYEICSIDNIVSGTLTINVEG